MTVVDLHTAITSGGLRLLVASGVPSPWSQAALSIFHYKRLPVLVTRTNALDPAFQQWSGAKNLPAVLMNDEPVRTGWADILALAERLSPQPSLIPTDPAARTRIIGLSHEIMSERALLWCTRLLAIDAGLTSAGREGFPLPAAQYLASRYGWSEGAHESARQRAIAALAWLTAELSRPPGPLYTGETLTALDLYSAAAMNALVPLPDAVCPMSAKSRAAFAWMGITLGDAITPALLAHRDHVVERYLHLPIEL